MKSFTFGLLFIVATTIYGQQNSQLAVIADNRVAPGVFIYQLPVAPPELKGSIYLDENWNMTNITLTSEQKIIGYPTRFDLKHSLLEIKTEEGVKVLNGRLIKNFTWRRNNSIDSSRFSNINQNFDRADENRIMQVLFEDKVGLYKFIATYVQKSNYNVALDLGEKDDHIKTQATYYFILRNKLFPISTKIKKNKPAFGSHFDEVKAFMHRKNLKLKDEVDLIKIAKYFNSL